MSGADTWHFSQESIMHFNWKQALAVIEKVETVMQMSGINVAGLSGEQLAHITQDALTTGKTVVESAKDIKQDAQHPELG
jgi:hypothetical protein